MARSSNGAERFVDLNCPLATNSLFAAVIDLSSLAPEGFAARPRLRTLFCTYLRKRAIRGTLQTWFDFHYSLHLLFG
jgi:hypothetical protein